MGGEGGERGMGGRNKPKGQFIVDKATHKSSQYL